MNPHLAILNSLAASLVVAGCSSSGPNAQSRNNDISDTQAAHDSAASTTSGLDRAYGSLHQMLRDESRVDSLLTIKSAGDQTQQLASSIARTSARFQHDLVSNARLDPVVRFSEPLLYPAVEQNARDGIRAQTTKSLLLSGQTFETRFLVSQAEALEYTSALADATASMEPNRARREWLETVGKEYHKLHAATLDILDTRRATK